MKYKNSNSPMVFVFTCLHLASILAGLAIIWIFGVTISEPLASRLKPFLLFFSVGLLYRGSMDYWIAVRNSVSGFKAKAIGSWLTTLVLVDVWASHMSISVRDIILLAASALLVLTSIWQQVVLARSVREMNLRG